MLNLGTCHSNGVQFDVSCPCCLNHSIQPRWIKPYCTAYCLTLTGKCLHGASTRLSDKTRSTCLAIQMILSRGGKSGSGKPSLPCRKRNETEPNGLVCNC